MFVIKCSPYVIPAKAGIHVSLKNIVSPTTVRVKTMAMYLSMGAN